MKFRVACRAEMQSSTVPGSTSDDSGRGGSIISSNVSSPVQSAIGVRRRDDVQVLAELVACGVDVNAKGIRGCGVRRLVLGWTTLAQ